MPEGVLCNREMIQGHNISTYHLPTLWSQGFDLQIRYEIQPTNFTHKMEL